MFVIFIFVYMLLGGSFYIYFFFICLQKYLNCLSSNIEKRAFVDDQNKRNLAEKGFTDKEVNYFMNLQFLSILIKIKLIMYIIHFFY